MDTTYARIAPEERAALLRYGEQLRRAGASDVLLRAVATVAWIIEHIAPLREESAGYAPSALWARIRSGRSYEETLGLLQAMKELMKTLHPHGGALVNHVVNRAVQGARISIDVAVWCLDLAAAEAGDAPSKSLAFFVARQLLRKLVRFEQRLPGFDQAALLVFFGQSVDPRYRINPRGFVEDLRAAMMSYGDLNLTRRAVAVLKAALAHTRFDTPDFRRFFRF
jgi:hypothetical protein